MSTLTPSSPPSSPGRRSLVEFVTSSIERLGAAEDESSSIRIARRTLVMGGLLMSLGGVLWGTLALVYDRPWPSIVPFGYIGMTALNFAVFARTRNFRVARFVQVFISLALPFAFQWALGGFLASGAVMLWAMVSLVGALTFSDTRESGIWLLLYCTLTILSGFLDGYLAQHVSFSTSDATRVSFLVLNLVVVSTVVFGLGIFLNSIRGRAVKSLEDANLTNEVLNAQLELEVKARDAQVEELRALQTSLHTQADELKTSLQRLQQTQEELVRTEKLAALGQLVAGVAHEVNTPLGVVYTAVSLGRDRLVELEAALKDGNLSRRQVLDASRACLKALEIAATNAERAAKLIADFKRVAVDQTSETVESIELMEYLTSIVRSLSPMLSRAHLDVKIEGAETSIFTRPGSIAQIVTNLLQNIILHAYPDPDTPRRAVLRCLPEPGRSSVVLEVEDWGSGMTSEVAAKAFEPFFTTKRGSGGSGLGMHIVHQQVYDALGGRLQIDTKPGRGTRIEIRLPADIRKVRSPKSASGPSPAS